ncbi:hypothetical protein K7X08_004816 [Anisodus acutangulus]|uniref:Uncharacterized protein n=1 Tax=Anisodus acutangulus TaxID=402998 RepID=A0A9Q1ME52_9SOLA|nr:hypothetical protein K7X08_004816 [Anisodus acutangulus]
MSEKAKKKDKERTLKEKVQTPASKFGIIHGLTVEVEKVDVPVVEPEKVNVPADELEKVVPVTVAKVEKAPKVIASVAQVKKTLEVIMPAALDEKTTNVLAQVNGKVVLVEVEVYSEKVVEGVITQINASLDN